MTRTLVSEFRQRESRFGWAENTPLSADEMESHQTLAAAGMLGLVNEFGRRMRFLPSARIVWTSLTDEQRADLGVDLWPVYHSIGTLGMWMRVMQHDNRYRALVDMAEEIGSYSRLTLRRLRYAVGSDQEEVSNTPSAPGPILPSWDRTNRQLLYGGLNARRVKVGKIVTSTQRIIEEFEEAGWPPEIPYPPELRGAANPHKPIHDLNKGLRFIRFHTGRCCDGRTIYWTRREL